MESIKSVQLKVPESINSIEICSVKIETINGPLIFSAVHRRPTIKIKCDDLSVLVDLNKDAKFVVAGDFNAHLGSNKNCTNGRSINEWFEKTQSKYKMKIMSPAKPTCSTNGTSSFIDFAIMSENFQMLNCDINGKLPSSEIFSDHSVFRNMSRDEIDSVCLNIENIFSSAIKIMCRKLKSHTEK